MEEELTQPRSLGMRLGKILKEVRPGLMMFPKRVSAASFFFFFFCMKGLKNACPPPINSNTAHA